MKGSLSCGVAPSSDGALYIPGTITSCWAHNEGGESNKIVIALFRLGTKTVHRSSSNNLWASQHRVKSKKKNKIRSSYMCFILSKTFAFV